MKARHQKLLSAFSRRQTDSKRHNFNLIALSLRLSSVYGSLVFTDYLFGGI